MLYFVTVWQGPLIRLLENMIFFWERLNKQLASQIMNDNFF